MAKKKIKRKGDSFVRDALILCGITVILALCLAFVYNMTKNPINDAAEEGKKVAYKNVFSSYDDIDIENDAALTKAIEGYTPADEGAKITEGVIVIDVEKNSAAEKGGIEANDIIIAINEKEVENRAYLRYELYKYKVGDTIKVKVLRNGKEKVLSVKLSSNNKSL